jgi:hypothetical protein
VPATSTVNYNKGGAYSNAAIVGLDETGSFMMQTVVGAGNNEGAPKTVNAIIDIKGCITKDGAEVPVDPEDGLFVALDPERRLDTRNGAPIAESESRFVTLKKLGKTVQAAFVTITGNRAVGAPFIVADEKGDNYNTSTVNLQPGETKANAAIVPTAMTVEDEFGFFVRVGNGGDIPNVSTHALADVSGVFLGGDPPTVTMPGQQNPPTTQPTTTTTQPVVTTTQPPTGPATPSVVGTVQDVLITGECADDDQGVVWMTLRDSSQLYRNLNVDMGANGSVEFTQDIVADYTMMLPQAVVGNLVSLTVDGKAGKTTVDFATCED